MGDVTKMWGFKYETPTTLGYEGWVAVGNCTPSIGVGDGPYGENTLTLTTLGGSNYYMVPIPGADQYCSMGFWFKLNRQITNTETICYIVANGGNAVQLWGHPTPGKLYVRWNNGSGASAASTIVTQANTWYHIQLDCRVKDTTLSRIRLRVNGVDECDSGLFNVAATNSYFTYIILNENIVNATLKYANLWVARGGFKGPCIVRSHLPNEVGWTTELTSYDNEVLNYAAVNEEVLDLNSYNKANVADLPLTDTYHTRDLRDIPIKAEAFAIKTISKKTGPSTAVLRGVTRYPSGSSGADDLNASYFGVQTSPTMHQFVWNDHPDNTTGALNLMSGTAIKEMFDDCEFGVKVAVS